MSSIPGTDGLIATAAIGLDQVPESLRELCRHLRRAGKRSWIVGGCVRDLLRGMAPADWDLATDALPHELMRLLPKAIPTGIDHGTVTAIFQGHHYEVTTLRGEGAYTDGRRPDHVEFTSDLTRDLARRDFTVNAIALDPIDGHVIDPFDGRGDLARRVIRAVGDAEERFAEDGLRVLRGARFVASLEAELAPDTERAMASHRAVTTLRKVSAERVRDEWFKSMKTRRPSRAFEVMKRTGLLAVVCPELLPMVGCEQNKHHAFDVWGHSLATVDACPPQPLLRVAALVHDIGKPASRAFSDKTNDYTFYEHERIGAELVGPVLERLRFSNDERVTIASLVRHHLLCYDDSWTDAAVRRWLRRVTPELAPMLYELGLADARGKGLDASESEQQVEKLRARANGILAAGDALSPRDLAVNGADLLRELELRPGRLIGELLAALVEVVTDDPQKNERAALLEAARAALAARSQPGGSA